MDTRKWLLHLVSFVLPTTTILLDSDPINLSGQWSVLFLLLTTFVTVGQKWLKIPAVKYRRALGLYAAWFTGLHLMNYFLEEGWTTFLRDWARDFQFVGIFAVLIMLALAVTSNKKAQQLLKANWAKLHKLSYVLIGLALVHWWFAVKVPLVAVAPVIGIAVFIFLFKKMEAKKLLLIGAAFGISLTIVNDYIPKPSVPVVATPEVNEVIQDEVKENVREVVSLSCVNGVEVKYYANGDREDGDCSANLEDYRVTNKFTTVSDGVYNAN